MVIDMSDNLAPNNFFLGYFPSGASKGWAVNTAATLGLSFTFTLVISTLDLCFPYSMTLFCFRKEKTFM